MATSDDSRVIAEIRAQTEEIDDDLPTVDVAIGTLISRLSPGAVLDEATEDLLSELERTRSFPFSVLKLYFRRLTEALRAMDTIGSDEVYENSKDGIERTFMNFYDEFTEYFDALDMLINARPYDTDSWAVFAKMRMTDYYLLFQIPNSRDLERLISPILDEIDKNLNRDFGHTRNTARFIDNTTAIW